MYKSSAGENSIFGGRGSRGSYGPWSLSRGNRGRAGYSRGFSSQHYKQARTTPEPLPESLGVETCRISNEDFQLGTNSELANAKITNCTLVASYTWLQGIEPTIVIPVLSDYTIGKPRLWTPPVETKKLEEDAGNFYRDVNAANFPTYPMAPSVRAVLMEQPSFDTQEVDIFACNSTLGNLLKFTRGVKKSFTILVEVIGRTTFFVRREMSPTELIQNVYGYGHTFPDAYTTWELHPEKSRSHSRIIKYDLSGLQCLVRFGCDGYIKHLLPKSEDVPGKSVSGKKENKDDHYGEDDEDESSKFGVELGGGSLDSEKLGQEVLYSIREGDFVPQQAIFDLKTRSVMKKNQDTLAEEIPRLWTAQIPNFVLAYHRKGIFDEINIDPVGDKIAAWEKDNAEDIDRFSRLLKKIISVAKDSKSGKLELRREEDGDLYIHERVAECSNTLPEDMMADWKDDNLLLPEEYSSLYEYGSDSDSGRKLPSDYGYYSEQESEKDYTACSADDCGYCGHCSY